MRKMIKACNRIIEYSFYALFLFVPLAFTNVTSELFELNKMWLTWGLTIIIAGAWFSKMILQRKIIFQRTPFDIPIALFLLSQIISTIFSLDTHVSLWGYYSRFNGGLLSIFSYVFLFYAFLSNSPSVAKVQRLMTVSLVSGLTVALWGLPSHFGYDPTCLLFRGTLDVSCWTADFIPTIRIFSTLGQPDWLAAYLAILIPITIAFWFQKTQNTQNIRKSDILTVRPSDNLVHRVFRVFWNKQTLYIALIVLFYVDLLYTRARSGFLGIWIALIFFFTAYFWIERKKINFSFLTSHFSLLVGLLLLITFVIGAPITQLEKLTLPGLKTYFQKSESPKAQVQPSEPIPSFESGGTESGHIRLNVWTGAINAWKDNSLIGTGVETFAYAYYKYKPAAHNLVSEWNFLYNKAHNEYLNYLATTGIVGLGAYLSMIFVFLWLCIKYYVSSIKEKIHNTNYLILNTALVAGYVSILITNFFGFSVVITNIYLFMIPAFVFVLGGIIPKDESRIKNHESRTTEISLYQLTFVFFIILASLFMILTLFRFWRADIAYALGYNLDRAGEYQEAYPNLHKAVELRGSEPVFKDELSINNGIIAAGLLTLKEQNKDTQEKTISIASALVQEAINTSNGIISQHSHNVVFWKTRTKLFYTLSQVDPRYLSRALDAIQKASLLAPQDANITYNLGVLYGQNNNLEKGIEALEKTIKLKPNYKDAHYALGLFYEQNNQKGKAIERMEYILLHLNPQDASALDSLKSWKQ